VKERSQKHNEQALLAALYWERGNKSISAESDEVYFKFKACFIRAESVSDQAAGR